VVAKMRNGVAGYAYYPTSTDGSLFFADGVIILNQYIGRIGTGQEAWSRALTHEIGHYLGLPHVWGDTNDPEVACGDDGIPDTPITKGYKYCPSNPNAAKICDPNIVENYQNYMDYSYCSIMFTKGQTNLMRNMAQSESGSRKYLISDSIHHLTGIDLPTVPLCAPVADFYANYFVACVGSAIQFNDKSWNAVVDSRVWDIQDASVSSTTVAQPMVTFNSPGWKKVTLTVTNAAGTDTKTLEKAIYVYPNWGSALKMYDFNSDNIYEFNAINMEPQTPGFEITWDRGKDGSPAYMLKYYKKIQNAVMYSNDYFYNLRKGGAKDYLYSPIFNLQYVTSGNISFDYAYATGAFTADDMTETLELQSSIDCGKNWIPRKTLTKMDLVSGGNAATDVDFIPVASQWRNTSVAIPVALQKDGVMFRFAFTSSDMSNNLYIDNVNITGTLMTANEEFAALNFNVYPNPTTPSEGVYVEYMANDKDVTLELTDLSGKTISSEVVTTKNTSVTHKMNTTSQLTAGVYLVKISQGTSQLVKKVVIL
jgi:PKD repeat protein